MSKRILLPTDGSERSRSAINNAVQFAKNLGASIVGIYAMPVVHPDILEVWAHHDTRHRERQQEVFEKIGHEYLAYIAKAAAEAGVPCTCELVKAEDPYRAILKVADSAQCDLIYMASHGCNADTANVLQLLGSETLKVLTHSKIPVLVDKLAHA
jgi:nucleotide-binding universal stress UspA family protein